MGASVTGVEGAMGRGVEGEVRRLGRGSLCRAFEAFARTFILGERRSRHRAELRVFSVHYGYYVGKSLRVVQVGRPGKEVQMPPLFLFSFSPKQRDCSEDHAPRDLKDCQAMGAWDGLENYLWMGPGPL